MKFLFQPQKESPPWRSWNSLLLLSLQMLEKFHHQLLAFVQINLTCNYLLISWKIIRMGYNSDFYSYYSCIHPLEIYRSHFIRSKFYLPHSYNIQLWFTLPIRSISLDTGYHSHTGAKRDDPSKKMPPTWRGITNKYEYISTARNFSRSLEINCTISYITVRFHIIKPTRCTNFSNLFLEWNSTWFGQNLCPSSGVFYCTHSYGVCHTGLLTACVYTYSPNTTLTL